jgi:hypothetical protein
MKPKQFTVNAPVFVPSANHQSTMNIKGGFVPTSMTNKSTEDSMTKTQEAPAQMKVSAEKYKTEMCKNWIENGSCRYSKKCQFAHGQ